MALTIRWNTMWKKVGVFNSFVMMGLACFLISGADCKRSACWRYGHVCWGGHGKRSGQLPVVPQSETASGETYNSGLYPIPSAQWNLPDLNPMIPAYKAKLQTMPFIHGAPYYAKIQRPISHSQSTIMMHNNLPGKQTISPHIRRWNSLPPISREGELARFGLSAGQPFTGLARDADAVDDALIIPDDEVTDSDDILANANDRTYASAFKRTGDDFQSKFRSHGTEEPLVTSANGLDASGSMATFFRDRKSIALKRDTENLGRGRFTPTSQNIGKHVETSDSARTHRLNKIYDNLPLPPYSISKAEENLPKIRMNY